MNLTNVNKLLSSKIISVNTIKIAEAPLKIISIYALDIDDCVPNPCQNGGVCAVGVDSYNCTCVAGFNGINCGIS